MNYRKHYKGVLAYVTENIDRDLEHIALVNMNKFRCPLKQAEPRLYNQISDLIDDYTTDNDLPQDWFYEIADIDALFWDID